MTYLNNIKAQLIKESTVYEDVHGVITFSINSDALDTILHNLYNSKIDYVTIDGDSYYTLPKKDFDRFLDAADSRGFNIDYENSEDSDVFVVDDLDEMSTSAGAGGYETPFAFGSADDDTIESMGYKKIKKTRPNVNKAVSESKFVKMSKSLHLNEISYNTYRKDPIATPKQKINHSINYINKGLKEIEKVVNHNVRLKQEMGVDNSVYWKSSRENLTKISERLLRVSKQLKELAS